MNRQEFLEKVDGGTDWKVYDKKLFEGIVDATLKVAAEVARNCYSKVAHPIAKMKCEEIGDKLDSLRNTKGAKP